jgi:hypothetical protein
VTLTEIAEKIDAHLKRLEADTDGFNSWIDGKTNGHRPFYFAGACRVGAYVHVCYVIYQGGRTLTKAQAAEYLAWLDAGNEGSHYMMQHLKRPAR